MPANTCKKLIPIYILKVLEEKSDSDHPLRQEQIIQGIYDKSGITCERKAVSAGINSLIDAGYCIEKVPNRGFYYDNRLLEECEITFLTDYIAASRDIPQKHAEQLIEKLIGTLSVHRRKNFAHAKAKKATERGTNDFLCKVDIITDVIRSGQQISFNYKTKLGAEQIENVVLTSPLFTCNNAGRNYLVCLRIGQDVRGKTEPKYVAYLIEDMSAIKKTSASVKTCCGNGNVSKRELREFFENVPDLSSKCGKLFSVVRGKLVDENNIFEDMRKSYGLGKYNIPAEDEGMFFIATAKSDKTNVGNPGKTLSKIATLACLKKLREVSLKKLD